MKFRDSVKISNAEDFDEDHGSNWRQFGAVLVLNLVTFLQGASLSTSSISTTQLLNSQTANNSSFFGDFSIDEQEKKLIGKQIWIWICPIFQKLFSDQSWLFGHIISSLISNPVAEIIGRKKSLVLDALMWD